jgi:hypothetical protein
VLPPRRLANCCAIRQATRWGSAFKILKRYIELLEFIDRDDDMEMLVRLRTLNADPLMKTANFTEAEADTKTIEAVNALREGKAGEAEDRARDAAGQEDQSRRVTDPAMNRDDEVPVDIAEVKTRSLSPKKLNMERFGPGSDQMLQKGFHQFMVEVTGKTTVTEETSALTEAKTKSNPLP